MINDKIRISINVILYLILCSTTPLFSQSKSKTKSVQFNEKMVLGISEDYYFGRLKDLAVDRQGNIYVADLGSMNIKVFNKMGKLVNTIGKRGRGPGEFLSIKEISFNNDDQLLVVDRMGFRITKFNPQGEVLNTYTMSRKEHEVVFFNQISQLSNGQYVVLYKIFGPPIDEDEILHIWDHKLQSPIFNFGSYKDLHYKEGYSASVGKLGLGSFAIKNDHTLLFAPDIYKGKIYKYIKKNKRWSFSGTGIEGYNLPFPSTETYAKNSRIQAGTVHTSEGSFKGTIFIKSSGIFVLKNGSTVNFILIKKKEGKNKGKWELGVELYDAHLNYEGFFPLKLFPTIYNPFEPDIRAKDGNDNFYMVSRKKGIPVVLKFSLNIQGK